MMHDSLSHCGGLQKQKELVRMRREKRATVDILYDIALDWLYILVTTFTVVLVLYAFYFVFVELDLPGIV